MSQSKAQCQTSEWEVDKIIGHKIMNQKVYYLTVWKPTIHVNYETEIKAKEEEDLDMIQIINKNDEKQTNFYIHL